MLQVPAEVEEEGEMEETRRGERDEKQAQEVVV